MECQVAKTAKNRKRAQAPSGHFGARAHVPVRYGNIRRQEQRTKGPAKKPTGFTTSSQCISQDMDRNFPGGHQHVLLSGGRAARAAVCPRGPREAVSRVLLKQKAFDEDMHRKHEDHSSSEFSSGTAPVRARWKIQTSGPCQQADGRIRPIGNLPSR